VFKKTVAVLRCDEVAEVVALRCDEVTEPYFCTLIGYYEGVKY